MKLFRIRLRLVATSYGDVEVLAKDEDAAKTMAELVGDGISDDLGAPSPPEVTAHVYECEEIQEPTRAPIIGTLTGKIEHTSLSNRKAYTMYPDVVRAYLAGYRARDK